MHEALTPQVTLTETERFVPFSEQRSVQTRRAAVMFRAQDELHVLTRAPQRRQLRGGMWKPHICVDFSQPVSDDTAKLQFWRWV